MPQTFTKSGGGNFVPTLVKPYVYERPTRNKVHDVINAASPSVTLLATSLRTGVLEAFFATRAAAQTAEDLLKSTATFSLADTNNPYMNMSFVVTGLGTAQQDAIGRWVLAITFQEIA